MSIPGPSGPSCLLFLLLYFNTAGFVIWLHFCDFQILFISNCYTCTVYITIVHVLTAVYKNVYESSQWFSHIIVNRSGLFRLIFFLHIMNPYLTILGEMHWRYGVFEKKRDFSKTIEDNLKRNILIKHSWQSLAYEKVTVKEVNPGWYSLTFCQPIYNIPIGNWAEFWPQVELKKISASTIILSSARGYFKNVQFMLSLLQTKQMSALLFLRMSESVHLLKAPQT